MTSRPKATPVIISLFAHHYTSLTAIGVFDLINMITGSAWVRLLLTSVVATVHVTLEPVNAADCYNDTIVCSEELCASPDCRCWSYDTPGALPTDDVPQVRE